MGRATTLSGNAAIPVYRDIGSKYDVIKNIQDKLPVLEALNDLDLPTMVEEFGGVPVSVTDIVTSPTGDLTFTYSNGDEFTAPKAIPLGVTPVTFSDGWTANIPGYDVGYNEQLFTYDVVSSYSKSTTGLVELKLFCSSVDPYSIITVLPVGYRPIVNEISIGNFLIRTNGEVISIGANSIATSLHYYANEVVEATYEYELEGTTITKNDGTRQLVNKGTLGGIYPLSTGSGLSFNGSNQSILTDIAIDLSEDTTILFTHVTQLTPSKTFGISLGGTEFSFGDAANGNFILVTNNSVRVINHNLPPGRVLDMALVISDNKVTLYSNGVSIHTSSYAAHTLVGALAIGGKNVSGVVQDFYTGQQCNFIVIPQALSQGEVSSHFQNPEKTLFIKEGVLKSSLLLQTTVDLMIGGKGVWLPMTEVRGGVVYNMAKPRSALIEINGDFSDGNTGWTTGGNADANVVSSRLQVTTILPGTSWVYAARTISVETGSIYLFEVEGYAGSVSDGMVVIKDGTSGGDLFVQQINGYNKISVSVKALSNTLTIRLYVRQPTELGSFYTYGNVKLQKIEAYTISSYSEAMRVKELVNGLQKVLITEDSVGLPTGLPTGLHFGNKYTLPLNLVMENDFTLDILLSMEDVELLNTKVLELGNYSVGDSLVGSMTVWRPFGDTLTIGITGGEVVTVDATAPVVVSYEEVGTTRSIYVNNVVVLSSLTPTSVTTKLSTLGSEFYSGVSSVLKVATRGRSNEERTKAYNKIKLDNGVV